MILFTAMLTKGGQREGQSAGGQTVPTQGRAAISQVLVSPGGSGYALSLVWTLQIPFSNPTQY